MDFAASDHLETSAPRQLALASSKHRPPKSSSSSQSHILLDKDAAVEEHRMCLFSLYSFVSLSSSSFARGENEMLLHLFLLPFLGRFL